MDFNKMAAQIIEHIGGKANIASLTHCATRLRFKLKDQGKASKDEVVKIEGVINVVESGGQFQVIIGNEVAQAFDAIEALTGISGKEIDVVEKDDLKVKGKFIDQVIELVTGIFTPILPALIGAGMIRALLMFATSILGMSAESGLYIVLNEVYNAVARNVLTPLITLLITVPLMFMIIGPVTSYLQSFIGEGYTWIYNLNPTICGILLGGLWQVLVVFGLHWGIVPLGQINLAMYGRNTINAVTGPSNWAQAGAALGVALKSKNSQIRQNAMSAAVTGFFSITEPAIYGVNLKYKKPFYIAVGCAAVSGGIAGFVNAAALAGGPVGVLSFPLFFGEGFVGFCIAMVFAFVASAVLTYLFGYDRSND